jgi:hypothetical protein
VRVKHLNYFGFWVLVLALAGCASIPKVRYNGPIPAKSAFTNQPVAIHTSVNGDNFHMGKGCILEVSTKCRNLTVAGKTMIHSYNTLLAQGLKSDGAQGDPSLSATYVIYTHMVPSGKHRYLFMEDYDIGRTMKQLIPFYTVLHGHIGSGRYYTLIANFNDDVKILHNGKVVWDKIIPIKVKTRIFGRSHFFSSGHSIASKTENVYRTLQSRAVAQILKASENLERQGSATQIIAAGATVPPVS